MELLEQKLEEVRERMVDRVYRHFKGNVYQVVDIVLDCETTELVVIYKAIENNKIIWCRKLSDFESNVDFDKYPNATQKKRFELV